MSVPISLVLESLILTLDLFDNIQRNGQLTGEALEAKIKQGEKLRKALVDQACDNPVPVGTPLFESGPTSEPSEIPSTGPSRTSSSELPANGAPYTG